MKKQIGIQLSLFEYNDISADEMAVATKYKSIVMTACDKFALSPSIIAAIISRESRWGLALTAPGPEGTGDFIERDFPTKYRTGPLPPDDLGFGRGLMQIDYDYHEFARTGNWKDPEENILYGCSILAENFKILSKRIKLSDIDLMRAAIASYNCGVNRVLRAIKNKKDMDYYTSSRNYSKDVLDRASFFAENNWI